MSIVKLNNRGVRSATTFGSITGLGSMVFIKKLTASSSATLSFVDGSSDVVLDDTYKEYLFTFKDIHPSVDGAGVNFGFNLSIDSGSNYNVTKTSSHYRAYHHETNGNTALEYDSALHLAQSTSVQLIAENVGADNDQSCAGTLRLFSPANTTFVKHYIASFNVVTHADYCVNHYVGGYANTTSAVDAIQFKFSSGNIDAGDICLYGIA